MLKNTKQFIANMQNLQAKNNMEFTNWTKEFAGTTYTNIDGECVAQYLNLTGGYINFQEQQGSCTCEVDILTELSIMLNANLEEIKMVLADLQISEMEDLAEMEMEMERKMLDLGINLSYSYTVQNNILV